MLFDLSHPDRTRLDSDFSPIRTGSGRCPSVGMLETSTLLRRRAVGTPDRWSIQQVSPVFCPNPSLRKAHTRCKSMEKNSHYYARGSAERRYKQRNLCLVSSINEANLSILLVIGGPWWSGHRPYRSSPIILELGMLPGRTLFGQLGQAFENWKRKSHQRDIYNRHPRSCLTAIGTRPTPFFRNP